MVIGENRRFLSALITFKSEVDMTTGMPSKVLSPEARNIFQKEL